MAARTVDVLLDNRMVNNWALELVDKTLDHGIWSVKPPDFVGDSASWASESNGFMTGTEGNVFYRVADGQGGNNLELKLSWDNPFIGSNSYTYTAWPTGQADGSGFSVGAVIGGSGNHPHVRFVLASGQCSIDGSGNIVAFYPLYASIWSSQSGPGFQARHGLDAGDHQQLFTDLPQQGLCPVQVSGYDVNGTTLFSSIWEERTGPHWLARHGLSWDEHQALFNELPEQGYRLVDVSGYAVGNEDRYASIWQQAPGPDWQATHGLNSADHQQKFTDLSNDGFRQVHVSGYNVGGDALFAAIYEKRGGPPGFAVHNATAAHWDQLFERNSRHRPVKVSGYSSGGRDFYAGIWEQTSYDSPSWGSAIRLTSNEHQAEFDKRIADGYRPICVSGYGLR